MGILLFRFNVAKFGIIVLTVVTSNQLQLKLNIYFHRQFIYLFIFC